MDMDLNAFFADLYEGLMMELTDNRSDALKAWDNASYSQHAIRVPLTEVEADFEEIEYTAWDVRCELEPCWTDSEEAYDVIDMASWDAECQSHAASDWTEIKYPSN